MLLMSLGQYEAACASLERSLIGRGWWVLQRRSTILAHLALAHALAGNEEKALTILQQVAVSENTVPSVASIVHEAKAVIDESRGRRVEALNELYLARQIWMNLNSRFNVARIRLLIARLQIEMNDLLGASDEADAALLSARELEAVDIHRQAQTLATRIAAGVAGR